MIRRVEVRGCYCAYSDRAAKPVAGMLDYCKEFRRLELDFLAAFDAEEHLLTVGASELPPKMQAADEAMARHLEGVAREVKLG